MASEKAMYWLAVSLLAVAVTNGFVKEYRGRVRDYVACAITWAEQGSGAATSYVNLGVPSREDGDLGQIVRSQVRVALAPSNMARHEAEMVRVQVRGIRVRAMQRELRSVISAPRPNLVIDLPQGVEVFEDGTF